MTLPVRCPWCDQSITDAEDVVMAGRFLWHRQCREDFNSGFAHLD